MACTYDLSIAIIDPKDHKKAMAATAAAGFHGATVVYGRGTMANKFLCALGMDYLRKEVLLIIGHEKDSGKLHAEMTRAVRLDKPAQGIMISLPLYRVIGLHNLPNIEMKGDTPLDYELITVIVDNGRGEEVSHAASDAGARGATILHGRGTGSEKVEKFFSLEIEPEKELVLIVAPSQQAESIIQGIRGVMDFDSPNSGILFSLDAHTVTGLMRGSKGIG